MQHSGGGVPTFVPRPQGSSAIKIVRPGEGGSDAGQDRPSSAASQFRARAGTGSSVTSNSTDGGSDSGQSQLCREFMLTGACTKPDCDFSHPASYSKPATPSKPGGGTISATSPSLSSAVAAPVFVPKNGFAPLSPPSTAGNGSVQPYTSPDFTTNVDKNGNDFAYSLPGANDDGADYLTNAMQSFNPYDPSSVDPVMMQWYDDGYHANDYFPPPQQPLMQQPLDYHLYTLPLPDTFSHNYFISDTIREELQKRAEASRSVPPGLALNLPEELQGYHSLVSLEMSTPERRRFGNWFSTVYKAVNEKDGVTYALRRVENYHLLQQAGLKPIESWSRIRHPNIIAVQEGFTTRNFGDNSLVVVYSYHPNSQTLADVYLKGTNSSASTPTSSTPPPVPGGRQPHFKPKPGQIGAFAQPRYTNRIPERTLWSFIVQIANATKAVHDAGMAVRVLDSTKILVTGKNRVRISSCGIVDVLMHDAHPAPDVLMLQQEDLVAFGRLIIMLCCANPHSVSNLPKAMEIIGRHYSLDVKNVVLFLITKPTPHKSISQLFDMLGSRLLTEMDEMQNSVDRLEGELMSELENGRLVRLLVKFGFINERPEFARDARWSETGDRYVIKLFRDYVFHQTDENGNPLTSLAHVLGCLSKLDAGSEERILLVARDEQSCVVATYKEIKVIVESAFRELSTSGLQMA